MSCAIVAGEMVTCLGDTEQTLTALHETRTGIVPLPGGLSERLNVAFGYPIGDEPGPGRVERWLAQAVARAAEAGAVRPEEERVAVIVGTGLRQFADLEGWWAGEHGMHRDDLHFTRVCRRLMPGVREVLTVANACAASGYALALADDMLAADEYDAVIVAGADGFTESMLTMVGRVSETPTCMVRPFDVDRTGVLLGEGAAAIVLRRSSKDAPAPIGVLRGVGLSCDAHHPTAPDIGGITRSMQDAHARADIDAAEVDVVVAHGTATALNDPTEAAALQTMFGRGGGAPAVTAVKGALGHTSGAAALMSAIVALDVLRRGVVPPIAGLRTPIAEARDLQLVVDGPVEHDARLAQVDAFGFGGVNAVAIVEAA